MKTSFKLNGKQVQVETAPDATLLWTLRDTLQMTGTKFGCGVSLCGACTVHLDGMAVRACVTSISMVAGRSVTTIEGLAEKELHPLQEAWIEEQVPQCGYCQSGQIMQAAALLQANPRPNREQIVSHMNGVLCRCGTYVRIVKAIESAASKSEKQ
ncbi:MAG: (2Fe-2S)-binding protein [Cyclobacteriaceae bacterium]|jgi:isoquinoline 1-oxidoreductase alpha subunit|nr:(2Fe-2S)-binding protein [Cyclobacteriaceae bacterium]MDH4298778.1 (2Fe-2S)-binding protein [Cyclobacteriaceae bacterium]